MGLGCHWSGNHEDCLEEMKDLFQEKRRLKRDINPLANLCFGRLLKVSYQLVGRDNKEVLFICSQGMKVYTRFIGR